jgi:hypothetical protein
MTRSSQTGVATYRDRKLSVSLCVFRWPLQPLSSSVWGEQSYWSKSGPWKIMRPGAQRRIYVLRRSLVALSVTMHRHEAAACIRLAHPPLRLCCCHVQLVKLLTCLHTVLRVTSQYEPW